MQLLSRHSNNKGKSIKNSLLNFTQYRLVFANNVCPEIPRITITTTRLCCRAVEAEKGKREFPASPARVCEALEPGEWLAGSGVECSPLWCVYTRGRPALSPAGMEAVVSLTDAQIRAYREAFNRYAVTDRNGVAGWITQMKTYCFSCHLFFPINNSKIHKMAIY